MTDSIRYKVFYQRQDFDEWEWLTADSRADADANFDLFVGAGYAYIVMEMVGNTDFEGWSVRFYSLKFHRYIESCMQELDSM